MVGPGVIGTIIGRIIPTEKENAKIVSDAPSSLLHLCFHGMKWLVHKKLSSVSSILPNDASRCGEMCSSFQC